MKTLGGVTWVRNGSKYDYCYRQAIDCLFQLCDKVVVLAIDGDDDTVEICKQYECENIMVVCLGKEEWDRQHGREKLAYFQNLALSFLDTDYYFLLQADEIIHQDSFPSIRDAIQTGKEAFYCTRINLWRDCSSYINVPDDRQPCSTKVIRLAKNKYKSVGDGESVEAIADPTFINEIRIFHMGFVRDKNVMKAKVINMQTGVFQLSNFDPKLDKSEIFDWSLWFNESELSPITESLPMFITKWAAERDKINSL